MNFLRPLFVTPLVLPLLCLAASAPEQPAAPAKKAPDKSQWVFSLLPKSLQKNPNLDLTVITEMTEAGKKLPPVSASAPAYYITQTSGPRQMGDPNGSLKPMPQEQVEKLLTRALAPNGYLPSHPDTQPPSLLIVYVWGTHNLLVEGDPDNPALSGNQIARNLLDRAALVGGEKFAKQMLQLFTEADAMAQANPPQRTDQSGAALGNAPILGAAQMDFANPVALFKMRSAKNEFLVDQSANDVYYVVASAYDYKALATKQRVLLWRTRMTVASAGVSEEQTLPTLIASAAPYFGKEMAETEIMTKRAIRDGTVDVGTPTVIESNVPAPAKKK